MEFNGPAYDPEFDRERLTGQVRRIFDLMSDRNWRTLAEIEAITGDPPASISAQLRHLRKRRFGLHTIERRARGDRATGLWEYQLTVNDQCPAVRPFNPGEQGSFGFEEGGATSE